MYITHNTYHKKNITNAYYYDYMSILIYNFSKQEKCENENLSKIIYIITVYCFYYRQNIQIILPLGLYVGFFLLHNTFPILFTA